MNKLEVIYLNKIVKYIPKETINTFPLINKKCKTVIERSTESYVVRDIEFLEKRFELLSTVYIPMNMMKTIPQTLLKKKLIELNHNDSFDFKFIFFFISCYSC